MRLVLVCCSVATALALCDCSSRARAPSAKLPLSIAHGSGSEYGNYAAQAGGEMRGPAGERCVIFDWDRPLTNDRAVRVRSQSCESKERPGQMVSTEISRTFIPLSQSNLKGEQGQARQ